MGRVLWIDASAGVAGDMLLAALLDAGVPLEPVVAAVDAVVPDGCVLSVDEVTRAGLRALHVTVAPGAAEQPHRTWRDLRERLEGAALPPGVRERAVAAFAALAAAEARVHGIGVDDVHFHEVGAWDSIADVVGVCAAVEWLGVVEVVLGGLALGSGSVRTAHGVLPVPVPAVLELASGWAVSAGGEGDGGPLGELATPTGVALVTTLASAAGSLPAMTVQRSGVGAGTRDPAGRANVVRVVLGERAPGAVAAQAVRPGPSEGLSPMVLVETNLDDEDPRVLPTVIRDLLEAGAVDAWLTPIVMKKGRAAHTLSALCPPDLAGTVRGLILDRTSALGVRQSMVHRETLERTWVDVRVGAVGDRGGPGDVVPVKVAHRGGTIVHVTPEFDAALAVSRGAGVPVRQVLSEAQAAAVAAGLVPGATLP